jgi:hypothetical protein
VRQTSFLDSVWLDIKDGNPSAMELFIRHYSAGNPHRKVFQFVGPGEKLVLMTPEADALFVWRKFISDAGEDGVNCAVFRNEGPRLSSELILCAESIAWDRWPGERLYTYVDPTKTRHKRDPGRCFIRAGWNPVGWTKRGLRILEKFPVPAREL